jgi:hypothetical protein
MLPTDLISAQLMADPLAPAAAHLTVWWRVCEKQAIGRDEMVASTGARTSIAIESAAE